MNQATQATTPTASTEPSTLDAERQAYCRASELMDRIVASLDILPRSAAVVGDLIGFRIQLNFGTNDPRGVLQFAELTDVEASRDHSGNGVWLAARAAVEEIPVSAEVLLSPEAAVVFDRQTPPPATGRDDAAVFEQAVPVPLGNSVLAQVPAITPVQPVPTAESGQ